jgi:clan AA aspartic protease (TIGR02281 family)
MRRFLELVAVFLLGGLLTLYFVKNTDNGPAVSLNHDNRPALQPQAPPREFHDAEKPAGLPPTTKPHDPQAEAKRYLSQGQMDLFMQLLNKHRSDADNRWFLETRAAFLDVLQQLKTSGRYRTAIEWLTAYLQSEYDDVVALQALADFHYRQKNFLAAIDTLYQAKSYAHDTGKISQIAATQHAIINQYATELKNHNDQLGLLDLYQRLVNVEPEYSANYVGLAEAYMALGNDADAQRTLNIIAYDPEAGAKVRQLLTVIESRARKTAADAEPITLHRHGNNMLAQVLFNNTINSRLLLDTGASLTVITPALLQNLGLDYNHPRRTAWFNTANGVVKAPIFLIERVSIGSQTVDQLEVAVMDLDNQSIGGLLGMNFLQHFRFSIDHQSNVLYLSPRS